jgi:hypothetical protein
MIEILEQAVNARTGQTVLRTNRKGWDELVVLRDGQSPQTWLAHARLAEERAEGQRLIAAEDAQIEREVLAAGRGVYAVQDVRTGKAKAFVHPAALDDTPTTKAPRATPAETPGSATTYLPPAGPGDGHGATLNPLRRNQLEMQREALQLIVDDKMSSEGARRAAAAEVADIDQLLALPATPGINSDGTEGRVPKQLSSETA